MNCQSVGRQITGWLSGQAEKAGLNGFVVGVSGGVDSALVSTLCARTGKPTYAISMPIHQAIDQLNRASKHIEWLIKNYSNVKGLEIDLTATNDAFLKDVTSIKVNDMARANCRSRLRMTLLYAAANTKGCLVAGTGNKVEDFGVGFFCKGGDGCVDISPIGDLLKSQVRKLASFFEIDDEIVNAIPTDGLWDDNKSDEDQIGATYDELEQALETFETTPVGLTTMGHFKEVIKDKRQVKVMEIFMERHFANIHKMEMPPVCIIPKDFK